MKKNYKVWITQSILLIFYKIVLDFLLMPKYFHVYGYLYSGSYQFDFNKWIISTLFFLFFLTIQIKFIAIEKNIYNVITCIYYVVCLIPMLTVYAFLSVIEFHAVFYPFVFWVILIIALRYYGNFQFKKPIERFVMPYFLNIDIVLLIILGIITLLIWAWAGFPIILSLGDTTAQRMALRAATMPKVLNYIFMLLGGVIFPYLFARYLAIRKISLAIISCVFGIILFFINGMKTWLFLYIIAIGIFLICKFGQSKANYISYLFIISITVLCLLSVFVYDQYKSVDLLSQTGRVLIIPNNIGFKSIDFFEKNELLYLRESILRYVFPTPYSGGSDFYINYGSRHTLTSSRANNGLWGDAFRNFGFLGMLIYPFMIAKIINIVETNARNQDMHLKIFVVFLMIWGSVNVSFFTWLITGGVVVIVLLQKIYKKNDDILSMRNFQE